MKYILTEEEYQKLKQEIEDTKKKDTDTINYLCQMVADKVPLKTYPGTHDNPQPWGCVRSKYRDWYCDNCPVKDICRMPHHYSK